MGSFSPLSPAELDALAESETSAYAEANAAYLAAFSAYQASLAAYNLNPTGAPPVAPVPPDPTAAQVAATYSQYGLANLLATGAPVPSAQPSASGAGWDVGTTPPGGTFVPQYTSASGTKARWLAYGWATGANGLADVRRALGITIGRFAEPPIS
jgi:hypothetical protein